MSDLKPCPFCGGGPIWGIGCHVDNTPYAYRVECQKCKYVTPFYPTREEAIESWNRRADDHFRGDTKMIERTAKVEKIELSRNPRNLVYKCKNCGQYTHRTSWSRPVMYCSSCGAKLDWSLNEGLD